MLTDSRRDFILASILVGATYHWRKGQIGLYVPDLSGTAAPILKDECRELLAARLITERDQIDPRPVESDVEGGYAIEPASRCVRLTGKAYGVLRYSKAPVALWARQLWVSGDLQTPIDWEDDPHA